MPDQIFENPRLVSIYDYFDGSREDLESYLLLAKELKAKTLLDVGCGTGCFACLAASHGLSVTAVDPASASLEFARQKRFADRVNWILGDASSLPPFSADMALMTGNVAQVFLTDEDWQAALVSIHSSLKPDGHLVFEVRDPSKSAWIDWTPEKTRNRIQIPGVGAVVGWCEVVSVVDELVRFRWTYRFGSDGAVLSSDSTIRFRSKGAIVESLHSAGFKIEDVRDAPDRPGKEFVFLASASSSV